MKTNNYLFRISCLELYYPIKFNDDICILPNLVNMRENVEPNLLYVDFNPKTFSYLLVQSDKPLNRKKLENLAKKSISFLTILILNQLYIEEYYHFKLEGGVFSLVEATILPFKELELKKKNNYLHGRMGVYPLNKIAGKLFKKILDNPISDSLYSIIMEYITSHKESLIEISGTVAWNVIEHMASRYWERVDRKKLYIITEKKLIKFIDFLDTHADQFITDNIETDDVTIDHPDYKSNYKNLLKRTIKRDILKFSPVKFRIFRMFEEEKILYEPNKKLIKDMYDIRVYMYHYGLSLEEIQTKIRKDPLDVIVKFKPFLYRKILEFLGFIDELFFFDSGYLIKKEDISNIPNILEEEPEIKTKLAESELIQKIGSLEDLFQKVMGNEIEAKLIYEGTNYKSHLTLSKNEEDYIITLTDFPFILIKALFEIPSEDKNYPEEIIRFLHPVICTFLFNNTKYKLEFYNRPIDSELTFKFGHPEIEKWIEEQTGKARMNEEETSKIQYTLSKITIIKN